MKTLIVYYSRTGHNAKVATELQEKLSADVDRIVDLKNREGMFGCVMAAMFKAKTEITFAKDPAAYDQVIVVSPLWGGNLPPATRTYLTQQRGKLNDFAFLSICGRGEENTNAVTDITTTAKQRPAPLLLLKETEVDTELAQEKREVFLYDLQHAVMTY